MIAATQLLLCRIWYHRIPPTIPGAAAAAVAAASFVHLRPGFYVIAAAPKVAAGILATPFTAPASRSSCHQQCSSGRSSSVGLE